MLGEAFYDVATEPDSRGRFRAAVWIDDGTKAEAFGPSRKRALAAAYRELGRELVEQAEVEEAEVSDEPRQAAAQ